MILTTNRNHLTLVAMAWFVSACSSLLPIGGDDPKNTPRRYTLSITEKIDASLLTAALRVEDFDAPAELAMDRIVVRRDAQEILYAKNARWTDKPTRLMRALVSDYLKTASRSIIASPTQIDVPIAYRLSGRLSAFQVRVTGDQKTSASVRFEALLTNTHSHVLMARTFGADADAGSDSPSDMAAAINEASNKVAQEITTWVATNAK
jgi:ABC-type uncharacterized transport system auxiliary subunit